MTKLASKSTTTSAATLKQRMESQQRFLSTNMLKAIAHPVRLTIVEILSEHPRLTVTEVQNLLGIEQAVTSQHLALMANKGVLNGQKVGRNKYVSLKYPNMKNIVSCLEECCKPD